jgi:hypothetical protein
MAKKNTIWLSYDEIDEILKDEIREHYLTGDFVVPDDWFEMAYDVFEEDFPMFDINRDDIEMDIYRNEYKITGSLNTSYNTIPPLPEEFLEYYDKALVYDVMFTFDNNEFTKDHYIDTDAIQSDIESSILPNDVEPNDIEVDAGEIELSIAQFAEPLKNAQIKYKTLDNKEIDDIFQQWLDKINASNIFFAETFTISEDSYDALLIALTNEIENKIADLVEETYDLYQPLLDDFYDKFREHFKESYESYYSNESADGHLAYRKFEIVVDENNKQLEVVDLDGEF